MLLNETLFIKTSCDDSYPVDTEKEYTTHEKCIKIARE
tara:strand:- start:1035 stop:1148 length:114 start_codon:yes stop_codon:yes gene_type:complete